MSCSFPTPALPCTPSPSSPSDQWLTTPWAIFKLSPPLRQLQPLMKPHTSSGMSKDQVRLWWWWGGSPHGHRDLTLPILLIFSSRCSLTMVASSWPLPHLATVHHCRRDWSYTPIKKTDISPPVSKERTGENTSLLINNLTYTVSAYKRLSYTWHTSLVI